MVSTAVLHQMSGNSEFVHRKSKVEARLEHLERHGYKKKLIDEDRRYWWGQRCPDCNRKGILHFAREFKEGSIYSLECWAFCVDCAWSVEV